MIKNLPKKFIDKLGYIYLKDRKILVALSKGKDVWYLPGGKRIKGESDQEALTREIKEELSIDLIPKTIKYYGVFEAQAHGQPDGTIVRVTCYLAEHEGELKANNEIAKIDFFTHSQKPLTSLVDYLIFDDLKNKKLLK